MKILFIGDSITNGKLGENFVERIRTANPAYRIQNLGRDGETLNQITTRLIQCLKNNNSFDVVVLQGGYNDLLLPTFKNRGKLFQLAYQQQLKKGNAPLTTNTDAAVAVLRQAIKEVKQLFSGKIILVTLGCLGEDLQSELNQQRKWLNGILEKVAVSENISITDTHQMVDTFLKNKVPSNYCLESFWAVTLVDRFTTWLSAKRKLHLTIDGVHLNKAGAEIFANSVLKIMERKDERTTAALQKLS